MSVVLDGTPAWLAERARVHRENFERFEQWLRRYRAFLDAKARGDHAGADELLAQERALRTP